MTGTYARILFKRKNFFFAVVRIRKHPKRRPVAFGTTGAKNQRN
ncbi:hypothetical protein LEP1GSC052_4158 [Leptospira kmetyi serovar Malaysia str. Bejo-Iso9]|nr:hypothetical protein LEP1GSC052_4158 [Leptospira kmetyi serovar Malaysia str. Bejo-Iso9]